MSSGMLAAIKAASIALTDKNVQKSIGWILLAIFSPLIVLAAIICSIGGGAAEHNKFAVASCFYGVEYSESTPAEYRAHIDDMRTSFSRLDSAISAANEDMEDGQSLDNNRIKAVFFTLFFGDDVPSRREAKRFVKCFYTEETRTRIIKVPIEKPESSDTSDSSEAQEDDQIESESSPEDTESTETEQEYEEVEETYIVNVPLPLTEAYPKIEAEIGRTITPNDYCNIGQIYSIVAGQTGNGSFDGDYDRGSGQSVDFDPAGFSNLYSKNAADLAAYAQSAWSNGWGYVYGSYGDVLTPELLSYKAAQYPFEVGGDVSFIQDNWLNHRTTDCVGLIKGYGWLNPDTLTIEYGSNGMPDLSANQMFYSATVTGPIDTIPDTPGIAVWHNGHIGVYIGDGYVIEAMNTRAGVVRTKLAGRGWTNWLQIPYISYS